MIFCDNCGILIKDNEIQYEFKIEMFAKPGILEFTEEDLEEDHIEQMNEIIDALEKMNLEEVEEETDKVWETYRFTLCHKCREEFHDKLKFKSKGG